MMVVSRVFVKINRVRLRSAIRTVNVLVYHQLEEINAQNVCQDSMDTLTQDARKLKNSVAYNYKKLIF